MATALANDGLLKFGRVLILIVESILGLVAVALLAAIPIVLLSQSHVAEAMSAESTLSLGATLGAISAALLLGVIVAALAFVFFRKLRQIIETVGDGDPFIPVNAQRLTTMGWITLATQLLTIPLGGIALLAAKSFEEQNFTVEAGLDLGAILLAVTLFILARVFRHGAAMREDLEGTV